MGKLLETMAPMSWVLTACMFEFQLGRESCVCGHQCHVCRWSSGYGGSTNVSWGVGCSWTGSHEERCKGCSERRA